jgi:uncharacterized membrane protein
MHPVSQPLALSLSLSLCQRSVVAVVIQSQSVKWLWSVVQVVNKQMRFGHYKKSSLSGWLLYAIIVIVSRACYESVMQVVNKQMNIWHNKKGGLAGWLWYAIIVVVLLIVLIAALRFLFRII